MTALNTTARAGRAALRDLHLIEFTRTRPIASVFVAGRHRPFHSRSPPVNHCQSSGRAVTFPAHTNFIPAENKRTFTSSSVRAAASSGPEDETVLNQTALYDLHVEYGGKMVPFGGFAMPVQYSDLSVGDSHKWTREKASIFDVGHMVQHIISGPGAAAFLESMTPISTATLKDNHSSLSCLLHPISGGIVDDTVITRLGAQTFYVVTNAACKSKDLAYLSEQLKSFDTKTHGAVDWKVRDDWGLIALQGPLSAQVLGESLQRASAPNYPLESLTFGQCMEVTVTLPSSPSHTGTILVSRGGYTGEDGFEIAIPPTITDAFTRHILSAGGVDSIRLAGLGARDSLRLEAGMCLYGHDLDDTTTPVEAGLSWVVGKDRRATGGFHGSETILRQLRSVKEGGGVERRRVGFIIDGAPAREGSPIVGAVGSEAELETIGNITSGCPSPTLGKNIAMGYIRNGSHKSGTEVGVMVRGKRRKAQVVKMPFVQSKYFKGAAAATAPG